MNDALQRWLALALMWRIACLLGMSLLLMLLAWWVLLRPQQQVHAAQLRQQAVMSQQVMQRQQLLAARPAINLLEQEIARLQQPISGVTEQVTLEALITERGEQLESWLPDNQPQQLQLRLGWTQFVPLFSELSLTRLPVPQRFELKEEQGSLNTQLWLEDGDAP
ncbi:MULTISPECIES: hypothetical protein [Erwiniaceae]|uniref:DNA utilization protein HofO C-terminal domain-containing protein n=1 Tax=Pantoea rwandensis TaxID=1076550 RepID=A0ABM5RF66_9GAMM|nr:hypothetical protein [Pantoea rwandensis]AIR84638.1 hypothetical protein LH22_03860 [Pantoea rwandensis]MBK0093064.1 hypothetical protein [Erwinia sp. S59]MBK0125078.1 hypothetical protein [Pantoea sp. S61]